MIRPCLTIKAALAVARNMILSLIDYGNIFLTGCTQGDKSDLQTLQNKILRCCLKIEDPLYINTIKMHNMLAISFVEQRRTFGHNQDLCLTKTNFSLLTTLGEPDTMMG